MSEIPDRNLRVCFSTSEFPPHVGGIARSAHRIVRGLIQADVEVCVFTFPTKRRPVGTPPLKFDGTTVYTVPQERGALSRAIEEVDRVEPFDLFHGFTLGAAFPCLRLAAHGRRPVIASIRGIDGLVFNDAITAVLRDATWITSVSSDSLNRAMEVVDISARSSFIPNSIEMKTFPQWQPTEANRGVVGTVATFRRKKNIPLLIQAHSKVEPGVRKQLLLVGSAFHGGHSNPERMERLNEIIGNLELSSEVTITGYVDNSRVGEYLLKMGVFVLSSNHEGLPNAILEAAAVGVPIVSTAVDGVKDIFTSGIDALLTPPGDPQLLAAAITQVLSDEDLACRLSAAARQTAAQLTPEAEQQAYLSLYRQVLNKNGE